MKSLNDLFQVRLWSKRNYFNYCTTSTDFTHFSFLPGYLQALSHQCWLINYFNLLSYDLYGKSLVSMCGLLRFILILFAWVLWLQVCLCTTCVQFPERQEKTVEFQRWWTTTWMLGIQARSSARIGVLLPAKPLSGPALWEGQSLPICCNLWLTTWCQHVFVVVEIKCFQALSLFRLTQSPATL